MSIFAARMNAQACAHWNFISCQGLHEQKSCPGKEEVRGAIDTVNILLESAPNVKLFAIED